MDRCTKIYVLIITFSHPFWIIYNLCLGCCVIFWLCAEFDWENEITVSTAGLGSDHRDSPQVQYNQSINPILIWIYPVNGGGWIYPTLTATSPTPTLHFTRSKASSFSEPTICTLYFVFLFRNSKNYTFCISFSFLSLNIICKRNYTPTGVYSGYKDYLGIRTSEM